MSESLGAKVRRLPPKAARGPSASRLRNHLVYMWNGLLTRLSRKGYTIGEAMERYRAKVGVLPPSDFRFVAIGLSNPSQTVRELIANLPRPKKEAQNRDFWCEDCEYRTCEVTATHCKLCGKELRLK